MKITSEILETLFLQIPMLLLDGSFQHLGHINKSGLTVLVEPQSELETLVSESLIIDCDHYIAVNQLEMRMCMKKSMHISACK